MTPLSHVTSLDYEFFCHSLMLSNVIYAPLFALNFISINQFTQSLKCYVFFYDTFFCVIRSSNNKVSWWKIRHYVHTLVVTCCLFNILVFSSSTISLIRSSKYYSSLTIVFQSSLLYHSKLRSLSTDKYYHSSFSYKHNSQ